MSAGVTNVTDVTAYTRGAQVTATSSSVTIRDLLLRNGTVGRASLCTSVTSVTSVTEERAQNCRPHDHGMGSGKATLKSQCAPTSQGPGHLHPASLRRRHVAARFRPPPGANQARQFAGLRWPLPTLPRPGANRAAPSGFGVRNRRSRVADRALGAAPCRGSLDPARIRPVWCSEIDHCTVPFDPLPEHTFDYRSETA